MKTITAFLTLTCIFLLLFSTIGCTKKAELAPAIPSPAEATVPDKILPPEPVIEKNVVENKTVEAAPIDTSKTSLLVGAWSLEKQLQFNPETSKWEPGIILDDGLAVEAPPEPTTIEFIKGMDSEWCAGIAQESGVEYLSMIPGGCWKLKGNALEEVGMPPEVGIGTMSWEKTGEALEVTITYNDETGAELSRNKIVLSSLK